MWKRIKNILFHNWVKRLYLATIGIGIGVLIFNYIVMPNITGIRREILTPDVVGMTEAKARRLLSYYKLRMSILGYVYNYMPEGVVVKQEPKPAKKVKEGRTVDVWISKGPERKVMPNIKGKVLQEGLNVLSESGITVDNIVQIDTTDIAYSGKIRNTDPPSGTFLPEEGSIVVYVYKYKEGVPNLIGLDVKDAIALLRKKNIPIKKVVYEDSTEQGIVVAQYPTAGKVLSIEDSVIITVGEIEE